jgi:7-keto-8-aminopelargonate synthetase-like enzyme
VCLARKAILYVDDAHGTGVIGRQGRGTVLDALGSYENTLVVGSLSKGFSCAGGFVGCSREMQKLLKMRSNTYIFGGPVVPPYLEAVSFVCDLLQSAEFDDLISRLHNLVAQLRRGLEAFHLVVQGGVTPILSVLVGGEEETLQAGRYLFDQGIYVQSVTFPAVPYHAGVLRIQVNANHTAEQVDQLVGAIGQLQRVLPLPKAGTAHRAA